MYNFFNFFALKLFLMSSLQTKMFSFVVLLKNAYYLFDKALHTCFPRFERHLLAMEGDKNVFHSVWKPLIIHYPFSIGKYINFEDSDDSLIVNREAINLFCK